MNGSLIKVFLFIISSLKLNLHILHPAVLSIAIPAAISHPIVLPFLI